MIPFIDDGIFFVIYGLIACAILRPISGHFAWYFMRNNNDSRKRNNARYCDDNVLHKKPTNEHWVGGIALSACIVIIWPMLLVWVLSAMMTPKIGYERKGDRLAENELKKLEEDVVEGTAVQIIPQPTRSD